jgi:hypothetical protein
MFHMLGATEFGPVDLAARDLLRGTAFLRSPTWMAARRRCRAKTLTESPSPKIMAQPLRVGVTICERDVTVRSDEIHCRALQAGAAHFRLPLEKV